jgi:3,4-dihydroxy 2-butanone 4-phosphate synthase/GTP cyclohydrolase II
LPDADAGALPSAALAADGERHRQAHRTNFTLSIEAAEGVTTGISAHDRAHTVKTAVAPNARPEDLRQPGHIFPLMAQPGGVLTRAGHTEAGCDLARLAGFSPAAMIVEILNDDGTMARRPISSALRSAFPENRHHRGSHPLSLKNERSVERIYDEPVDTEYGGSACAATRITSTRTCTSRW